ncbi:hypothetical protein GGR57DRAFT_487416 [Xylariaceae sp. FL1272]|nr:hypothetical protein GGR57DRAFT_487416 [Xylariaceae sp. FL1272]
MASIGPSLPPHLAKRKRDEDEETSTDSPPAKIRASDSPIGPAWPQQNTDEVALDSDDEEDDIGPSAPPETATSIGPAAPPPASIGPSQPPQNTDEIALDSDDDDDIGPSAPPQSANTKRSLGPALPPSASIGYTLPPSANTHEVTLNSDSDSDIGPAQPPQKRTYGPSAPPAPLSERLTTNPDTDSDSDSDYGPALPSSTTQQARAAHAATQAAHEAANPSAPRRDDWMLAPPPSEGYRASDPSKLKARKFNSGPRASSGNSGGGELSSIWTETPEEKRKRLEAAVLGRETASTTNPSSSKSGSKPLTREEQEHAARIQSAISASRGKSLYEEHQATRDANRGKNGEEIDKSRSGAKKAWADEEDDDPSKRAFDKEKDMKLGGRIGASQRRELVTKAADFGGRFSKGKFL